MCFFGWQEARKYHRRESTKELRRLIIAQSIIVKKITDKIDTISTGESQSEKASKTHKKAKEINVKGDDIEMQLSNDNENNGITILSDPKQITLSAAIFGTEEERGSCSICLGDFEIGEEVGCSHNGECTHVFHKECIVDWLLIRNQCPVCRRDFMHEKDYENLNPESQRIPDSI